MSRFVLSLCLFSLVFPAFAITQEEINERVEKTALATYKKIHEKGLWHFPKPREDAAPEDAYGRSGITPKVGQWRISMAVVSTHSGNLVAEFRYNKPRETLLTQALDNLEDHEASMDCLLGVNYVALRCAQNLLGDDRLNTLCQEWESHNQIGFSFTNLQYNPLVTLLLKSHDTPLIHWKGRGAIGTIANDPNYAIHIAGPILGTASNLNLFQVGSAEDQTPHLMGFDAVMYKTPITPQQAETNLINAFNSGAQKAGLNLQWSLEQYKEANQGTNIFTFGEEFISPLLENGSGYQTALQRNLFARIQRPNRVIMQIPCPDDI